jgi:DNA-binding PadR family transcriptional regulator
VAEVDAGEAPDDDGRRKYYRLSPAGRARLLAEADRLEGWAEAARRGVRARGA